MTIVAAILLLGFQPQEEKPKEQEPKPEVQEPKPDPEKLPVALAEEAPPGLFVEGRAGVWVHGSFEASTPLGSRRIRGEAMGEGGIDLGYRLGRWKARASFDYGSASDVVLWTAGLHVGPVEPVFEGPGGPIVVGVSVGVLLGGLEVDQSGFGSFRTGVGFQARAELSTPLTPALDVSLWADYRYLSLRYKEAVISGDTSAIGSGAAFGVSLTFQF